jgi:hypothetical protein
MSGRRTTCWWAGRGPGAAAPGLAVPVRGPVFLSRRGAKIGACYTLSRSAGSLGDRMRTPALMHHALGQLADPPLVFRVNPGRPRPRIAHLTRITGSAIAETAGVSFSDGYATVMADVAASRPLARETAGRPRSARPGLIFPAALATAPVLTARYGLRPDRIPGGHVRPGGAG